MFLLPFSHGRTVARGTCRSYRFVLLPSLHLSGTWCRRPMVGSLFYTFLRNTLFLPGFFSSSPVWPTELSSFLIVVVGNRQHPGRLFRHGCNLTIVTWSGVCVPVMSHPARPVSFTAGARHAHGHPFFFLSSSFPARTSPSPRYHVTLALIGIHVRDWTVTGK